MIKKLLNLIYEAIGRMIGYKSITDAFDLNDSVVSDDMSKCLDLWKDMYKDESPWLDDSKGIYSLGLPKQICQSLLNDAPFLAGHSTTIFSKKFY